MTTPDGRRKSTRKAAPAVAAALLLAVTAGVDAATAQEACWSAAALAGRKEDPQIRHGADAFRMPPQVMLAPFAPLAETGAIRRVELPPDKKLVALTFDLCETPDELAGYQGDIVDFLRRRNIKATFFAGGKWMLTHRTRAQQLMADRRFEIANHSWEHRNLRLLDGPALEAEIGNAQAAYETVRSELEAEHPGQCVVPGGGTLAEREMPARLGLFRFPFGACDQKSLAALAAQGLQAIQWDVAAGDPAFAQTAEMMKTLVLAHVRPGSIIVFHANGRGWHTGEALPAIVAALEARGYGFVTVSELIAAGTPVVEPTCFDLKPGDTDRYDALARRLDARYQAFKERLANPTPAKPRPAPVVRATAVPALAPSGGPVPSAAERKPPLTGGR